MEVRRSALDAHASHDTNSDPGEHRAMSTRERWTVYPLLFLTLGIALTDKVTRQVSTDSVVCKSLLVTDRQGKAEVIVASSSDGGFLHARGTERSPDVIVGHYQDWTGLLFVDGKGNLAVRPGLAFPAAPRKPVDSRPEKQKPQPARPPQTNQPAADAAEKAG
jgi:hypothetical protein